MSEPPSEFFFLSTAVCGWDIIRHLVGGCLCKGHSLGVVTWGVSGAGATVILLVMIPDVVLLSLLMILLHVCGGETDV